MAIATVERPARPRRSAAELQALVGRRRAKNIVMTGADGPASSWSCGRRSAWCSFTVVVARASVGRQLRLPHRATSRSRRGAPGPGMGPAIVGTLLITRVGHADRGAARHPRRGLPQRVRRTRPSRPGHPLHGQRDDRRAVDRHGPVHLRRLGRLAASGSNGFAGALALACLMLPIVIRSHRGDAALVPDHLREASLRPRAPARAARS